MMEPLYSLREACRSCGVGDFFQLCRFKPTPVAGIYYDVPGEPMDVRAPMTLRLCRSCGLVQLSETISPEIYRDCSFVGDSAAGYEGYLRELAAWLVNKWGLRKKRVFEIGGSNGVLLSLLKSGGDNDVSGIEPSRKLCESAAERGVALHEGYFDEDYLDHNGPGRFDCVIVRHVLEHIDDLNGMMKSIKRILEEDGLLIVEVPDLAALVRHRLYSNILHEHLNYFSLDSLETLAAKHGLITVLHKENSIHGGSLVLVFRLGRPSSVSAVYDEEGLEIFFDEAERYYAAVRRMIVSQNHHGKVVHGYGASHRTFITMGRCGLDYGNVPVLYDNNRFLHHRRLNGIHALVEPREAFVRYSPDVLVIFATSYEDEIREVFRREYTYKGEIVSLRYENVTG